MLNTPVAFIIFNRPEKTARVFEAIRQAQPRQLFVIADGPRTDAEKEKTDATRAIIEQVDWDCLVYKKFEDRNLGVKKAPPEGISWVFEHVDRAIFLEDDCLPDPTFFAYCEELLEKYKDNERVMHISGDRFAPPFLSGTNEESYHFSRIVYLWGWATWRRAWRLHDTSMREYPQALEEGKFRSLFPDPAVQDYWEYRLGQYYRSEINSWDGPWVMASILHGVCINPSVNLISNIGVDEGGAHAPKAGDEKANLPTFPMRFPLVHPASLAPDAPTDALEHVQVFYINKHMKDWLRNSIKWHFPKAYGFIKKIAARL